jgi:hypothetical protein
VTRMLDEIRSRSDTPKTLCWSRSVSVRSRRERSRANLKGRSPTVFRHPPAQSLKPKVSGAMGFAEEGTLLFRIEAPGGRDVLLEVNVSAARNH